MNQQYKMEIQRQVDELVSKGLVRESLSPCAVCSSSIGAKERWKYAYVHG